eukprot:15367007-Ditylum_brightwellii.AAC.1
MAPIDANQCSVAIDAMCQRDEYLQQTVREDLAMKGCVSLTAKYCEVDAERVREEKYLSMCQQGIAILKRCLVGMSDVTLRGWNELFEESG